MQDFAKGRFNKTSPTRTRKQEQFPLQYSKKTRTLIGEGETDVVLPFLPSHSYKSKVWWYP